MIDIGLLLIRIVIGSLLAGHGAGKLFGWYGGFGLDGTAEYFESLGYRRGRVMAILAGLTEGTAGLAFAAGFLTPLAAAGLIGIMINASVAAHGAQGLWAENEGYEYPLVLAVVAAAVALMGAGSVSVDAAIGWSLHGLGWGSVAVLIGAVSALVVLSTRRAPARQESQT